MEDKKKLFRTFLKIFLISIIFLFGCEFSNENNTNLVQSEQNEVTLISDLENIAYFRDGALEHILEGELNRNGQAVGFHYDRLPTKKGEIVTGTETERNELGVYEAEVIVSNVEKTSNGGKSSFFPDEWDTQEVVNAISEAYEEKEFISGNTYEGLTSDGMIIRMYLDNQDKIISAFPIY